MAPSKAASNCPGDARAVEKATRLRQRCEGKLLNAAAPVPPEQGAPRGVPRALARCDGADIVKKNAARKKKYLFSFPGSLKIRPNGRIGDLSGLDTATPTLDIVYSDGRLRLQGSLVFPRNAILTMKGSASRGKSVRVVDTFETVVVFSEWKWLGLAADNPGDIGKPLPLAMQGKADSFWGPSGASASRTRPVAGAVSSAAIPDGPGSSGSFDDADDGDDGDVGLNNSAGGDNDESDDSVLMKPVTADPTVPRRTNPRRGKRRDYSQMVMNSDDDESEDDPVEDDAETSSARKRRGPGGNDSNSDDSDDLPLATIARTNSNDAGVKESPGSREEDGNGEIITLGDTPERAAKPH